MKTCPDCANTAEDHAKFCDNCGHPFRAPPGFPGSPEPSLETVGGPPTPEPADPKGLDQGTGPACPHCGLTNVPGEVYCYDCGTKLPERFEVQQPELPPAPLVEPEDKPMEGPSTSGSSRMEIGEAPVPIPPDPASQPAEAVPTTTCATCGHVHARGEMFCQNCGSQLTNFMASKPEVAIEEPAHPPQPEKPAVEEVICPNCSHANLPIHKFCENCGHSLTGSFISPSPPLPAYSPPGPPPDPHPTPLVSPPRPETITGRLVVQNTDANLPLPPGKLEILIGRKDEGTNVFPDIDLAPHGGAQGGVSRAHARLIYQGGQLFLRDLKSTNFSFLNREKLSPGQDYPLSDGDEVRFGRVVLVYYAQ